MDDTESVDLTPTGSVNNIRAEKDDDEREETTTSKNKDTDSLERNKGKKEAWSENTLEGKTEKVEIPDTERDRKTNTHGAERILNLRKTTEEDQAENSKEDDSKGDDDSWDVAAETPMHSVNDYSNDCWNTLVKVTVIVGGIFLFLVVFGSACISRIIVHTMIWKLNPPYTNNTSQLGKFGGLLEPIYNRLRLNFTCTRQTSPTICDDGFYERNGLPNNWYCQPENNNASCLLWEELPSVNVGWIWSLLLIMVTPSLYTFLDSLWRCCFKKTNKFHLKVFLLCSVVEFIHTTGLCVMVFVVLPEFDPTTASAVSLLSCLVPFVLSLKNPVSTTIVRRTKQSRHLTQKEQNNNMKNGESTNKNDEKTNGKTTRKDSTFSQSNGIIKVQPYKGNGGTGMNQNKGGSNKDHLKATDSKDLNLTYFNIAGMLCFCISLVFGSLTIYYNVTTTEKFVVVLVLYIISIVMISVIWWENFAISNANETNDVRSNKSSFLRGYVFSRREQVTALTFFLKIGWTFLSTLIIFVSRSAGSTLDTARTFLYLDQSAEIFTLTGKVRLDSDPYVTYGCIKKTPYLMAVTCFILAFVCFKASRYACRVVLQHRCYAAPLTLNLILTPALFVILMRFPLAWTAESCNVLQPLWEIDPYGSIERVWPVIVCCLFGLLSVFLLSAHVWATNGTKMEKEHRLFTRPAYCGIFLDLSLLLTRRRVMEEAIQNTEKEDEKGKGKGIEYDPLIYFCATMWHETENEMTQLLKSIFRADYEAYLRKKTVADKRREGNLEYFDEDYYEFEVHIFFDDAFKPRKRKDEGKGMEEKNDKRRKERKGIYVNDYVHLLEKCVHETAKEVYSGYCLQPVKKYRTPYGARYVWQLLSEFELIVHLKDKTRIRARKRWSQVMYMYYLLSFKMDQLRPLVRMKCRNEGIDVENIEEIVKNEMKTITQNTFILALDGDVDFKPDAVTLLVDRMKKNPIVGAACGRIHPIGSGPMVWYQKFEYAVSHWLQKATEHVIGCVLCSPGCFSLFRASAVLADNVMKTYTRRPTEALHHIQYDQGEDRWLCTLMLKQGYRVEYCAASDALTFAPEGFNEFYKQRRRWAPSTMANILDLLLDWRYVKRNNQNISLLYICYHIFLFVSSILTPGTIFLLILGAIITAFPDIEPWLALILNLLPVIILVVAIYLAKEDVQLLLAGILSTIYSLVMLVVFIGLLKEGIESELCSVTTVFFCFVAGVFIISAILHPQEFTCLFHGFLYFLAVPSMSMLLQLYSVGNLNVVTWGTRENKSQSAAEEQQRRKNKIEGHECSIGDWCRCILCTREIPITEEKVEVSQEKPNNHQGNITNEPSLTVPPVNTNQNNEVQETRAADSTVMKEKKKDSKGKHGVFKECENIDPVEEEFWHKLIKKYLEPVEMSEEKKVEIKEELEDLRNKVFFFFLIINAIFVTIVYVLTQVNSYQGTLSISLPCQVGNQSGKIEPISIAFTLTFGLLLLIQFLGMLYHRISTITQIIASAKLADIKRDKFVPLPQKSTEEKTEPTAESKENEKEPMHALTAKQKWAKVLKASRAVRALGGEKTKKKEEDLQKLRDNLKIETVGNENDKVSLMSLRNKAVNENSIRRSVLSLRNQAIHDNSAGTSNA